jgi:antibiotic biosynthesis monooxygenase (ABM) superfamily enzyme
MYNLEHGDQNVAIDVIDATPPTSDCRPGPKKWTINNRDAAGPADGTRTSHCDLKLDTAASSDLSLQLKVYHSVYQFTVASAQRDYFERVWDKETLQTVLPWKGFINRTTHRIKSENEHDIYVVTLAFDCYENLRSWHVSDERKQLVDIGRANHITVEQLNAYGGATKEVAKISVQLSTESIPRPRPLPRWKIFLLTSSCAACCNFVIGMNDVIGRIERVGFPVGLAIFLNLWQLVVILIYGVLPSVQTIPWVDKWLRLPRAEITEMTPMMSLLDQGLLMFSAPVNSKLTNELTKRIEKLERRLEALRQMHHNQSAASSNGRFRNIMEGTNWLIGCTVSLLLPSR